MTKPREFWLEIQKTFHEPYLVSGYFTSWERPSTPDIIHVREISKDEIRVSRQMWDELKSYLGQPGMTNRETHLLNTMIQIERIEQESK